VHQAVSARRILVADDDPDSRELMRSALSSRGHEITVVHDGRELLEALDRVHPHWFDLVVTDHRMPHVLGLEALARAGSRSRFVIVTALDDPQLRVASEALGAAAILRKPIELAELFRAVDDALARSGDPAA
jgi:CheY-like chemotaxis protein